MKLNILFSFLLLLIIAFWFLSPYLLPLVFKDIKIGGKYGELFNAINSLFSGLAFLGVIYTVVLQRQELKLQREELVLTRNELQRSAKAQEESEKALTAQVKSLSIAAKINGLTALIEHYNNVKIHSLDLAIMLDYEKLIRESIVNIQMLLGELDQEPPNTGV